MTHGRRSGTWQSTRASPARTLTTTPSRLTDGLEKGLSFLNIFKVPVAEVALMMSIALRFIPILIEEGTATLKGNKFAKEFISEDLAKKAFKGNCLAYLSYLGAAVLSGLAAMTAVKIKDKKIAKKDAAMQQKMSFIQSYQSSL